MISRVFRWVKSLLLVIVCVAVVSAGVVVGTNAFVIGTTSNKIVAPSAAQAHNAQCIVVLGASVLPDGSPSGILQDRLDAAIALYKAGAAPKMLMSGDNGDVSYNEGAAMKNYAIEQGVPSEDIFNDHAGFSTYETMYRAKNVFGAQRVIVVTQTYHLYRALYAANGLGMEAIGVASDAHTYKNQTYYDLREVPARTKDFFQTLLKVPSTFVGAPISLNQSGDIAETA